MSNTAEDKSPIDTVGELKLMVVDYARQETVGPLQRLGRWTAFGVVGAIMVGIGLSYLAFGLLRYLQTLETFQGDTRNFYPYLIAFGGLLVFVLIAFWAMTRKFSTGDSPSE